MKKTKISKVVLSILLCICLFCTQLSVISAATGYAVLDPGSSSAAGASIGWSKYFYYYAVNGTTSTASVYARPQAYRNGKWETLKLYETIVKKASSTGLLSAENPYNSGSLRMYLVTLDLSKKSGATGFVKNY